MSALYSLSSCLICALARFSNGGAYTKGTGASSYSTGINSHAEGEKHGSHEWGWMNTHAPPARVPGFGSTGSTAKKQITSRSNTHSLIFPNQFTTERPVSAANGRLWRDDADDAC
jgi:hypothetical protein